MKKYISAIMIALTAITITSCDKKVDVAAVSAILPGIELSSVGMLTPGPYVLPSLPTTSVPTPVNTIQVVYGGSTTNKAPGAIDVFITDSSVKSVGGAPIPPTETLHFNSWIGNDSFNAISYGTASYITVPSEYPNTTIYQGSIILKIPAVSPTYPLGSPLLSGKTYNVKVVLYSSDYTTATASTTSSSFTVNSLFAIQ